MWCKTIFLLVAIVICASAFGQTDFRYTSNEREYARLFDGFKSALQKGVHERVNIQDSAVLKNFLLKYLYAHSKLDTASSNRFANGELTAERFRNAQSDLRSFYRYFAERADSNLLQHLSAKPSRLASDKCIYDRFTAFQKQNSFVYYDDRHPDKVLGFILFIPKLPKINSAARIWSWTLLFRTGSYAFRSITGEEGMEMLFLARVSFMHF